MRSKRFMTLRFPPKVDAARKLRCCDINFSVKLLAHPNNRRARSVSQPLLTAMADLLARLATLVAEQCEGETACQQQAKRSRFGHGGYRHG